jgi:two-component system, OmpR family, heavy metal sensor histidine kinase CusS
MRFERVNTFCQTLRFRLTLWNTAIVLIFLALSLVAIREGLQLTLAQMVDEFINEELYAAIRDADRLGDVPDRLHARFDHQATGHPRRQLFIQLLDNRGELLWSSAQSPPPDAFPPGELAFDAPKTVGEYRIICGPLLRPDPKGRTVRVGCSLERAHQDMNRFSHILAGVGLLVLLAVPVGGYLLAGRTTRPLSHINRTTARLDPMYLDERLPLRGTSDELDQLSGTINGFLDRIAAYLRQSRDFTANAAHELRSPLTALQSSLEVALNADRTTEEYKEVLSVLLEECGPMRVLVNQLLLLAEGDAGRLPLHAQALRLDQIVASSLEMFQVIAEAADVELMVCRLEPILIHGDGNRLWQMVNNLIDNAIKFTPPRGRVCLTLRLDAASRQGILEVADTGIGIAPQDLPRIFDRFFQGDKARERQNRSRGVGLGLSICQAVVEAHGGTIQVSSAVEKGTTFTVRLPDSLRPSLTDSAPASSSVPRGTPGDRVVECT